MSSFNPFQIFNNPFDMEDLAIFDDSTLQRLLHDDSLQLSIEDLASSLCNSSAALIESNRTRFVAARTLPIPHAPPSSSD